MARCVVSTTKNLGIKNICSGIIISVFRAQLKILLKYCMVVQLLPGKRNICMTAGVVYLFEVIYLGTKRNKWYIFFMFVVFISLRFFFSDREETSWTFLLMNEFKCCRRKVWTLHFLLKCSLISRPRKLTRFICMRHVTLF